MGPFVKAGPHGCEQNPLLEIVHDESLAWIGRFNMDKHHTSFGLLEICSNLSVKSFLRLPLSNRLENCVHAFVP